MNIKPTLQTIIDRISEYFANKNNRSLALIEINKTGPGFEDLRSNPIETIDPTTESEEAPDFTQLSLAPRLRITAKIPGPQSLLFAITGANSKSKWENKNYQTKS
ncbi:unnamed protein product [Hermetia illucens]|uniref:Uncharacterized protein n=1 Tax=Hermetia illucens TaxID=343691 RepID=A0A7R8UFK0_HERIL|nr:unnamed protein product [Hermetia illucens]CAD7079908.1 unnamed protein product [Hermetia illucens]